MHAQLLVLMIPYLTPGGMGYCFALWLDCWVICEVYLNTYFQGARSGDALYVR